MLRSIGHRAFVLLVLALCCSACAGGGAAGRLAPGEESTGSAANEYAASSILVRGASGFTLEVLRETFLGAEPQGGFALDVSTVPGSGAEVRVRGERLSGLRAFYARLHCPDGFALDQAAAGSGLGTPDEVLSLCHGAGNVVDLGAVLQHCDQRSGISGAAELARVTLRRSAAGAVRTVSFVPARTADRSVLYVNCTTKRIEWEHRLLGDYDQNGAVNIADLTPLGMHWGAVGQQAPDEAGQTGVCFPAEGILQVLDSQADQVINLGDFTALGVNFDAKIEGWNLYRSPDPATDFPDVDLDDPVANGTVPSKIARFAYRPFAALAYGDPQKERLRFSIDLPLLTHAMAYWVRPVAAGAEGTPSNWSPYDQLLASQLSLYVEPETLLFDPGVHLDLSACTYGAQGVVGVVDVSNATTARYFVFRILFDPLDFYPQESSGSVLVASDSNSMWREALSRLGYVKFAEYPTGFKPPLQLGNFTFVRQSFSREPQLVYAATPINAPPLDPLFSYQPDTAELTWYYDCRGEAGQDGEFWWDDFASVDYYMGKDVSDPLSAAYLADTNHDGDTDIGDITPIGASYGKAMTGYNIYMGPEDRVSSSAMLIGHIALNDALGDPLVDRLHFSFTVPNPQPGQYLWLRTECYGSEGVASRSSVQIP